MPEPFIHKLHLKGEFPKRDNRFALAMLVAESVSIYYWCEAFAESRPVRIVIMGQRGLAEYAVRAVHAILAQIDRQTNTLNETEGFKFGSVIALREALRLRREEERRRPEYMDQCNVSTYRAKALLDKCYKVGVKDVKTAFDIEGYRRGEKQIWTLKSLKTPTQVLDEYVRRNRDQG